MIFNLFAVKVASNMLVLIIDDDTEDGELFIEAVREVNSSITCVHAKDGREALRRLRSELPKLPDYIFLDINMPVMNGRECIVEIKKTPQLKNIPVIMYSTTTDTNEIRGYYKLGAHDFLIKPGNFTKLIEALDSIIVSGRKAIR
jgi:CheY-like chemotaxis protein